MEFKSGGHTVKQLTEAGELEVVFATLGVVDLDGDLTEPGAFGEQIAHFVPAHSWGSPQIGKVKISEEGDKAIGRAKINLRMNSGKEWYEALKFDFEETGPSIQEYSYGFEIEESGERMVDGRTVRLLKKVKVFEVSPVIRGAGVGTGTLALKETSDNWDGLDLAEHLQKIAKETEKALERISDIESKRLLGKASASTAKDLARLFSDIKEALLAPPPEEIAARLLARNYALRQRIFESGTNIS